MRYAQVHRRLVRPLRDFLLGLAIFAAIAAAGILDMQPASSEWLASAAHARLFETEPAETMLQAAIDGSLVSAGWQMAGLASMALAFAATFALNMWFAGHLRRMHAVYARRR